MKVIIDTSVVMSSFYTTLKHISLVNETLISPENWQKADLLTRKVDNKDIAFVALALQLDAFLWTLDKPLTNHLRQNDFDKVVNTGELVEVLSNQN